MEVWTKNTNAYQMVHGSVQRTWPLIWLVCDWACSLCYDSLCTNGRLLARCSLSWWRIEQLQCSQECSWTRRGEVLAIILLTATSCKGRSQSPGYQTAVGLNLLSSWLCPPVPVCGSEFWRSQCVPVSVSRLYPCLCLLSPASTRAAESPDRHNDASWCQSSL